MFHPFPNHKIFLYYYIFANIGVYKYRFFSYSLVKMSFANFIL